VEVEEEEEEEVDVLGCPLSGICCHIASIAVCIELNDASTADSK
jgi:hypothetical protein